MSEDISLLPEGMRKKEETVKKTEPAPARNGSSELRFSTPLDESEDIETIEIDEGEVEQVLANEPFLTRMVYKTSEFFSNLGSKLFHPGQPEPPPKLPPQFFAPPPAKLAPVVKPVPTPASPSISGQAQHASAPSVVSASSAAQPVTTGAPPSSVAPTPATPAQVGASLLAAAVAPSGVAPTPAATGSGTAAKPKARIVPAEQTPRRVRVIKRVRKPVRVSFVSEDDLRLLHVDVPKRKFTLAILTIVFVVIIAGGLFAIGQQQAAADTELAAAQAQAKDVQNVTKQKQQEWSNFQDLQPRLKALIVLLNGHMSPTHLLALLEEYTLKDVQYDSFSLTPDHKVALSVVTDSYESAARQIVVFQSASFVKSLEASGYAATYDAKNPLVPSRVTFQMILTLDLSALQ